MEIPSSKLEICLEVLQQISENPSAIGDHKRLKSLITKIYKQGKKAVRREIREKQQIEDRWLRTTTQIVQQQLQNPVPTCNQLNQQNQQPLQKTLNKSVYCYICKQQYTQLHFFYHSLCPKCAEFNYQKRNQRTDLTGRVALVTGGRIKIGYQTALQLLRDGAKVIVTTRFPRDCVRRFSNEADFGEWKNRLQVYGLDLRYLPALENFINYLTNTEPSLDIIINNAAQTIKRPLEFYRQLLEAEKESLEVLPGQMIYENNSFLLESQLFSKDKLISGDNYFPLNTFDTDGQQLDMRPVNSWSLRLDAISTVEMLEVQLVNNIAPFILNSKLKKLLMQSPFRRRFIINVSAMEGQFNRKDKTCYHPHTNMAKAALNMMTRTSAIDYVQNEIYMNSVDTGWITDENPYPKKTLLQEKNNFYTPLDIIDGMARIYDPIVQGIENPDTPVFGQFLKDYQPYTW
jgi:NAD(P)-dependent dehydrogenase (short-subunit alcohol dehydrogenase family)